MSKSERRVRPVRRNQIESLEDRLAMSADPLPGFFDGAIGHHGLQEEPMQVAPHAAADPTAADQAPALTHHALQQHVPPVSQHGDANTIPPLSHQTEQLPDFWLDPVSEQINTIEDMLGEVEQTLSSAHGKTGLNDVRANYGFRGGGQTVAVIDSGIAYDHYALGGGFGSNYRVVGGWDFTAENDADPYDDGPEGSHGTHVAGIIGSSDNTHQGVAPDVDLVGLRVFDDHGAGYFSWVEDALQWVYANRDAFENPITAVNLSLGTNWNSETVPSWAMLENEFAQLESVGIFISVSAGNSFTSYNTPGLSYPAASPYVVPVMSMDDSGVLSYFSQRHQSAIAAPGRYIYSTIPDYAGNNNGTTDDWANFSGTSMAAPYVAGASVIIREAMEFVGMTNIDQDTIYAHMLATADTINDSATGLAYSRLNVSAAIDALMPTDDYGSTEGDAYDLGTISGGLSTASLMDMNGVISTLNDSDFFTFTAGSTGTVTFSASNATHNFDATWQGFGGEGWADATGDSYTMNVVAGQQYSVALSSGDGLGYYQISVSAEETFTYTDWGAVAGQQTKNDLTADTPVWYRIVASQDGFLTGEAFYDTGAVDIDLYDAGLNLIDTGANDRVDHYTTAGAEFFLRIEGSTSDLDVRLTNMVSLAGATVTVDGTAGDEDFSFTAGETTHAISIGGLEYTFAANEYDTFTFDGGAGNDSVSYQGLAAAESAILRAGSVSVSGSAVSFAAQSVEDVRLFGGINDSATFYDSSEDDEFVATSQSVSLQSSAAGYSNHVTGFGRAIAYATAGGNDSATLHDSAASDYFVARPEYALIESVDGAYYAFARGFDTVSAHSTNGGIDSATFFDSADDDNFVLRPTSAQMTDSGSTYDNAAYGFDRVMGYAQAGGNDRAVYYDSTANDTLFAKPEYALMWDSGNTFWNYVSGFDRVEAYAVAGGLDRAVLFDSAGNDRLVARPDYALISDDAATYLSYVHSFERVESYATRGGEDRATMYDSEQDDRFVGRPDFSLMWGINGDYWNFARGFDRVDAFATLGGNDQASLFDSAQNDDLTASGATAELSGSSYLNRVTDFDLVRVTAQNGGDDSAEVAAVDFTFEQIGSWS